MRPVLGARRSTGGSVVGVTLLKRERERESSFLSRGKNRRSPRPRLGGERERASECAFSFREKRRHFSPPPKRSRSRTRRASSARRDPRARNQRPNSIRVSRVSPRVPRSRECPVSRDRPNVSRLVLHPLWVKIQVRIEPIDIPIVGRRVRVSAAVGVRRPRRAEQVRPRGRRNARPRDPEYAIPKRRKKSKSTPHAAISTQRSTQPPSNSPFRRSR